MHHLLGASYVVDYDAAEDPRHPAARGVDDEWGEDDDDAFAAGGGGGRGRFF
jgi:hypothetical protein